MEEISVKLYSPNGSDIRRFPFQIPTASGDLSTFRGIYATLLAKVKQIFPIDGNSGIQLAWKDEEGDLIVMESDAEVKEALRKRKGDIFRIYPRLTSGPEPNQQQTVLESPAAIGNEPTETKKTTDTDAVVKHGSVICDGCNQNGIEGIRFKCLICPDFDLCGTCEGKRTHDQHPMLRLAKANDFSWMKAFTATQRMTGRGSGGCMRYVNSDGHEMFPRHGMSCGMGQFPNAHQQQNGANNAGNQQEQHGREIPIPDAHHFLRDVGQAVAAVLNGLGIDVDVDVDHEGQRTKVVTPKNGKQEEKAEEKKEEKVEEKKEDQATNEPLTQTPAVVDQPLATATIPKTVENTETAAANGTLQDWTLLDTSDAPTACAPPIPAVAAAAAAPSVTNAQIGGPLYVTNPQVAAALLHMMSMGFTNEGGWLTQLLELKNGDISAVLELLHPSTNNA